MTWDDEALLLSLTQKSKTRLVLNLLSADHGRLQCKMKLDPNNKLMLLPGSKLRVRYIAGELGKMGEVFLDDVDAGILTDNADDIAIVVILHVNKMLSDLLEPDVPARSIYAETLELFMSLAVDDKRWPIHYARWEMALIKDLGFARGFDRCRSAYQHGEAIYFSPRRGMPYPRDEVGAFVDKMMPVPAILMGARNATIVQVREALELTSLIYEKFLRPELDVGPLGDRRAQIAQESMKFRTLPTARKDTKPGEMSDEDRRRRMESIQPLMVQTRASGA